MFECSEVFGPSPSKQWSEVFGPSPFTYSLINSGTYYSLPPMVNLSKVFNNGLSGSLYIEV